MKRLNIKYSSYVTCNVGNSCSITSYSGSCSFFKLTKLVYINLWYNYVKGAVPVTVTFTGLLAGPNPNWLIAVTITTTVSLSKPSGNDGAVNVSVVVELLTFIISPL